MKSKQDMLQAVEENLQERQTRCSRKTLNEIDWLDVILLSIDIIRVQTSPTSDVILFPDYDTQTYSPDVMTLQKLVAVLNCQFHQTSMMRRASYEDYIHPKLYLDVYAKQLIALPSHYISTTRGLYDIHQHKYLPQAESDKYYSPKQYDVDLTKDVDTSSPLYAARTELFNVWSQDNPDVEYALRFFQYLALLGDSAEHAVFLIGTGGNGKSTYQSYTINLVGREYCTSMNLNQLDDDNILSNVNSLSRLIYGRELPTSRALSSRVGARLKSLAMRESIVVNRKYLSALTMMLKSLFIQASNEMPRILGFDAALKDRMIAIDFGTRNHRKDPTSGERIKELTNCTVAELVGDEDIYGHDEFLTISMHALIKEFEHFDTREKLIHECRRLHDILAQMLENLLDDVSDDVTTFLQDKMMMELFTQPIVPISLLYLEYCDWLTSVNPGSKPCSAKKFTRKVTAFAREHDLTVTEMNERRRPRTLSIIECNVREFTSGLDYVNNPPKYADVSQLAAMSRLIVNNNPTSLMYELSSTHDEMELTQICNQLIALASMDENAFYALSQAEMRALYDTYRDELISISI